MATAGWDPRIEYISPRITQTSISFDLYIIGDINGNYKLEFYLYDTNGNQIQYASINIETYTNGQFGPYTTDTIVGLKPFTILSYKVVFSYLNSGTVIDTKTGEVATKIEEFNWDRDKISGGELYITANEWNRLLDTCAKEVLYVGNGSVIPNYVKGVSTSENPDYISAKAYNYVLDVLSLNLGYKSGLKYVTSGKTVISASLINLLKTTINKIINLYDYNEQPEPRPIDDYI